MPKVFRTVLAFALLLASGSATADDAVSIFEGAVAQKLARLAASPNKPHAADAASEQIVLVDVTSDGAVINVEDRPPVANEAASAKLRRLVLMGSPFPRVPKQLTDYSAVRLAIVYAVSASDPVVLRVEVKGGLRYVDF